MKMMTYNILNGGLERLSLIIDTIKKESPDYLTINEANTFALNNNEILKHVAKESDFTYFDIALSGEQDYHVAVFSKYPFLKIDKPQPLARACLIEKIKTEIGELSIASLHLTPYTEDLRHSEIDLILKVQQKNKNKILVGDMNSLSKFDKYKPEMTKGFNEMQTKKFTTNGKLRFDAIDKIMSVGYHDAAYELKKNFTHTAPTFINEYFAHTNMRLDYIFLSESLLSNLRNYSVITNKITAKASDHYPIVVELIK